MISLAASVRNRLRYIVSYLRERSRGLDFTLPDRMYDRRRHDGAMYYATAPEVLADLFACVDSARYDRFLDVGCGKGYVLAEDGYYECNATPDQIRIEKAEKGQEILLVIGEQLNRKKIDSFFDISTVKG